MNPERRARWRAWLTLAASALPWFGGALWGGGLLYFRDLIQNFYPWRRFWAAEISQGRWPLWDPYAGSGVPFLANPNNLSLYPPAWLPAVLPFDLAFNWLIIGTWLAAEAGAYRLARVLGLGCVPALLSALAWGGCGFLISALNLPNVLVSAAACPWVAWGAVKVARRGAARDAAALGLAVAVCIMGGEPMTLGVALACAALILAQTPPAAALPARKRWKAALAAGGLALLLSAPLLLPALQFVRLSERGGGLALEERSRWALGAFELAEIILPRLAGDPTSFDPAQHWAQALYPGGMPLFVSLYAGVPLLCLAALGWSGLRPAARASVAAGVGLCLVLASAPVASLLSGLWGVGGWLRYPSKLLIGFFGPVCILAGFGLQRLRQPVHPGGPCRSRRAGRLLPLALGLTLAATLALDLFGGGWLERWSADGLRLGGEAAQAAVRGVRASLTAGLGLCGAALLLTGPLRRRMRAPAAALAWMILVGADLWLAQRVCVPSEPPARFQSGTVFPGHILAGARVFREERPAGFRLRAEDASRLWGFLWDRQTLARGSASEAGIHNVLERPTDRLWPAATARLRRWALDAEPAARARLLRRLGVEWWMTFDPDPLPSAPEVEAARGLSDPPLRLRRIGDPLPAIFWTDQFGVARDEAMLHRGLTAATGPEVWLESGGGGSVPATTLQIAPRAAPAGEAPPAARAASTGVQRDPGIGACRVLDRDSDSLELRCEAPVPGLAVVLDAWYPGWEVRVNGARMESLRANGIYRAVALPAGRHAVVWRFRPLSHQVGRALGLLGVILCVAAASKRPSGSAGSPGWMQLGETKSVIPG